VPGCRTGSLSETRPVWASQRTNSILRARAGRCGARATRSCGRWGRTSTPGRRQSFGAGGGATATGRRRGNPGSRRHMRPSAALV